MSDHAASSAHASSTRPEQLLVALAGFTLVAAVWLEGRMGAPMVHTLYGVSYLAGGYFGARSAWFSLREGKIDIDLLMVLAALGALVVGAPFEGALLLFLFALSNQLQSYAMGRTHEAIGALARLRPQTARVLRDGKPVECPLDDVRVGESYRLRPGEQVPLDGLVREGESQIDQSTVTGESMPVHAQPGGQVFAGSQNLQGALTVEVTRAAKDSTLARMIALVEEAQHRKAKSQRFLESAEQNYALGVIVFTVLLILALPTIFGLSWEVGFYRAITVMVVASPCALVISTPATILSAIANGARHGILFKGGAQLEKASRIRTVAFDKTGTLTLGRPEVVAHTHLPALEADHFWHHLAALEADSSHPLAQALRTAALPHLRSEPSAPADFAEVTAKGVTASFDGTLWAAGKPAWLAPEGFPAALADSTTPWQEAGHTVIALARRPSADAPWEVVGACAIADPVRPEAAAALAALRALGVTEMVMLTGDARIVGESIARQIGLTRAETDLLPEEKVAHLRELAAHGEIAMVGDGTNDAPALATASLGIAMGAAGSDIAMESADVVLMASDLHKVSHVLALSRAARRIVWQNLIFAGGIIVIMVLATLLLPVFSDQEIPLPLGVLAHEGGTVLVCLNGLRLLAFRPAKG